MSNNSPELFTVKVPWDDLVIGTKYKIVYHDGRFQIGTHVKQPDYMEEDPRSKDFRVGTSRVIITNVIRVEFFKKPTFNANVSPPREEKHTRKSRKQGGRRRSTRRRRV